MDALELLFRLLEIGFKAAVKFTQNILPRDLALLDGVEFLSMRAVNFVSTMSGNLSSISFVTTLPSGVMRRNLPSLTTYSRSMMVETVGA